ncbi:MAG: hydrolase [Gammaproteobacteria bacterium]|nr:hydrolase [Gammaproteobacteria bacterium]
MKPESGKIIASGFKPAWWLPSGNLQTLWPYFFRRRPRLDLVRERLELPDGDFVDLCLTANAGAPVVCVLHGLEGCIDSHYVKPLLAAVARRGWHGVFMHWRGCSGTHNRLARSYHSGDTGDIGFLLEQLRRRFPGVPLAVTGYSLGGNALLKYLGEASRRGLVQAAAAVSVPYDLAAGARRLNRGFSRVYQRRFLNLLKRKLKSKFDAADAPVDLDKLAQLNDFFSFDGAVTAPLHGFAGADDYYTRSSSRQFLRSIDVPTLLLHARDDPFMTEAVIPAETELSEYVQLELVPRGGHIGFVGGRLPGYAVYWLERRIIEFFEGHL